MFEELDNYQPAGKMPASAGLPASRVKAEDIFKEVDKSKPEVFKANPSVQPIGRTVLPPRTGWMSNKIIVFGLLFGGFLVIMVGGFFSLKVLRGYIWPDNKETQNEIINYDVNNEEPADAIIEEPAEPAALSAPDSDQDGLSDAEESGLGTSINDPDTDRDGLTDREEVKVYGTNPREKDSDGDSYPDGDEINNGYNPRGAGKLLELNKK